MALCGCAALLTWLLHLSGAGRLVLYGYGIFVFFTAANYVAVHFKDYGMGGRKKPLSTGSFSQVPERVSARCSTHEKRD